jgi:hypothetical protein
MSHDVEIGGMNYRVEKMPTRIQWNVARRLMPVVQGILPILAMGAQQRMTEGDDGSLVPDMEQVPVFEALAALSNTIGLLSDADSDYIIDHALDAVRWQQGGRWMPLRAPGGAYLNGNADNFDIQLRLVLEVLRESVANFSLGNLLSSQMTNGADKTPTVPTVARPTAA